MAKIGLNLDRMDSLYDDLYSNGSNPFGYYFESLAGCLERISALTSGTEIEKTISKANQKVKNISDSLEQNYNRIREFLFTQIYDYRVIKNDFAKEMGAIDGEVRAIAEGYISTAKSETPPVAGGTSTSASATGTSTGSTIASGAATAGVGATAGSASPIITNISTLG